MPDTPTLLGPASGDGQATADAPTLSDARPRRDPLIPPHIAWPAFVVLLLLTGVGSAFQALFASQSDGGVQLAESYGAVTVTELVAAADLGACEGGLCSVRLTLSGAQGLAARGLAGTVTATHAPSGAAHTLPLAAGERPGTYVQVMPVSAPGTWRFDVDARRGAHRFAATTEATANTATEATR